MAARSLCNDRKSALSRLFVIAETIRSKLASTRKLAEQIFPVIAWIRKILEHRPNFSFQQRQVDKAIMIISRLTEHGSISSLHEEPAMFHHFNHPIDESFEKLDLRLS